MEQKFLKIETVQDIYTKSTQIAEFICPSKNLDDIEYIRNKVYSDMLEKAFKESKYQY